MMGAAPADDVADDVRSGGGGRGTSPSKRAREVKTASCPKSAVSHRNSKDELLTRVRRQVLGLSCDTQAPR